MFRLWGGCLNMSHIRSISLCDESYEEAKKIGNLSKFVRTQLLKDKHQREGVHTGSRKADPEGLLCNAMLNPTCSVCWPYGRPQQEDWVHYVNIMRIPKEDRKEEDQNVEEWILNQARLNNPRNIDPYTSIRKTKKIRKKQTTLLQRLNPMRLLKFQ